jgi:hypothetical protein
MLFMKGTPEQPKCGEWYRLQYYPITLTQSSCIDLSLIVCSNVNILTLVLQDLVGRFCKFYLDINLGHLIF